jgi:hypothetical protein
MPSSGVLDRPLVHAPLHRNGGPGRAEMPLQVVLIGLAITTAGGLLAIALAYWAARTGRSWGTPVFWVGLLVLVLPLALRLCGRRATPGERLAEAVLLGLALYVVPLLLAPNGFVLHDELGHLRSVSDILRTGRLYVRNPLVPAYAYYPGILSVTAALSKTSGLGAFASGVIVVAVARAMLMAGLFLLVRHVFRSARVAGIAAVIYVANPNFVFFDSQFAYESLALGLAAVALYAVARSAGEDGDWRDLAAAALLDGALVLTHHLTSYAVTLVIVAWTAIALLRRSPAAARRRLVLLALFSLAITIAYAIHTWGPTSSDIGGSITGSLQGLVHVITGGTAGRAPFKGAHGYSVSPLEQVVGIASVLLLVCALPFGLWALWRRRALGPGPVIFGLAALVYPISIALRLSAAGSETSNRTSEFLFLGLGVALAAAFMTFVHRGVDRPGLGGWALKLLVAAYIGIVFAGGITVGTPSYSRLPSSRFGVSAGARSVDPESVAAAQWAGRTLPAGAHFLGDTNDTSLLTGYSRLVPQSGDVKGVGIGELFLAPRLGSRERTIVTYDKLRFLVVDLRDASALPASGSYFDSANPVSSYATPIPRRALTKFGRSHCIDRVFASRNIVIYDTEPLLRGCR